MGGKIICSSMTGAAAISALAVVWVVIYFAFRKQKPGPVWYVVPLIILGALAAGAQVLCQKEQYRGAAAVGAVTASIPAAFVLVLVVFAIVVLILAGSSML